MSQQYFPLSSPKDQGLAGQSRAWPVLQTWSAGSGTLVFFLWCLPPVVRLVWRLVQSSRLGAGGRERGLATDG